MSAIKELREKAGELGAEISRLNKLANDDDHTWSAEDETEWTRVNSAYDENAERVKHLEDKQKRADEIAEQMNRRHDYGGSVGREDTSGRQSTETRSMDEDRLTALQGWIRNVNDLDPEERHIQAAKRTGLNIGKKGIDLRLLGDVRPHSEQWHRGYAHKAEPRHEYRAMSVGTDADGGYTVPEGFQAELEQTMLAFNGPRRVCRVLRTATGNALPLPTSDDTGNSGALLAENTTIGSSVESTFGVKTLNAYKYSSTPIMISQELLEDSAFNLSSVIAEQLGERLGRITAAHFTTGTGSSQPNGIVTATSAGKTTAAVAAITAQELIDLEHSIDPAYRDLASVGYMFHDNVLAYLRKLVDGDSRPLWNSGMSAGVPDTLHGRPYTVNQQMSSTITATDKTVLFGAFEKYVIRDVSSVRLYRLEERYRDLDQTGFIAFSRHDGELINTGAVKHLIQAAS